MTSESGLWNLTRESLSLYGRLTRIENKCELGTPDVAYSLKIRDMPRATSGWLELKHVVEWPAREETVIKVPSLKLEQVLWLEAEARSGGRAWCLLQINRAYILLTPMSVHKIYDGLLDKNALIREARIFRYNVFPTKLIVEALVA